MTEQQAISKVVSVANGQVGYREGDNNWNKYAADLDPLGVTFGAKQNQPWCGEFVLWVFNKAFGNIDTALKLLCSPKPTGIPLCATAAQYFKDAGRWFSSPQVGDVVFFNVNGGINHTGIVTNVSGGVITTVEGNSSDMVARRNYAVGSAVIAGFGRPKWAVVADNATVPATEPSVTTTNEIPMLKRGDKGEVVKAAQFLLNGRGASVGMYGADGDFGPATQSAVLAFQRRNGLEADGIIGPQTWAALLGL